MSEFQRASSSPGLTSQTMPYPSPSRSPHRPFWPSKLRLTCHSVQGSLHSKCCRDWHCYSCRPADMAWLYAQLWLVRHSLQISSWRFAGFERLRLWGGGQSMNDSSSNCSGCSGCSGCPGSELLASLWVVRSASPSLAQAGIWTNRRWELPMQDMSVCFWFPPLPPTCHMKSSRLCPWHMYTDAYEDLIQFMTCQCDPVGCALPRLWYTPLSLAIFSRLSNSGVTSKESHHLATRNISLLKESLVFLVKCQLAISVCLHCQDLPAAHQFA